MHLLTNFKNKLLILRLLNTQKPPLCCYYSSIDNSNLKIKDGFSKTLPEKFDSEYVESQRYEWWEKQGYFKPNKSGKQFTMLLPPPNVTGTLHLGHALTATIQDVLCRWKKMKGESVLWIPGTDHAGIATQVAVEKHMRSSLNLTKHDLGREGFIKEVWKWKDDKEKKIIGQLKQLGCVLDWNRHMFTMDPSHSLAVTTAFIKLYEKGIIYRNNDMVNWSCALQSAISDIEIDRITVSGSDLSIPGYKNPIKFGVLYKFAYKVCDEDEEIVVATTRPETMIGDTAVAVHPNDPRYQHLQNKFVWHPFRKCKIPIIFDEFVDKDFGTGAVKITPSSSLTDFEVGKRHHLETIHIFNECGFVSLHGDFYGLKRFDARKFICDKLNDLKLFKDIQNYKTVIPVCSRSGDVIEMMIKPQWFLKCGDLAKKLENAILEKKLKIEPDYESAVLLNWIRNIRDWNLSRQLWWGHQIPMYECSAKNDRIWVAARDADEAKKKAREKLKVDEGEIKVEQDSDVLDTWFSSGLLPLSRLGWPNVGDEFVERYPLSLMETGNDIVFFWVARMIMLGMELTGKLPFENILLHGIVCDSHGRKMSKSLGNVILPEHLIKGISLTELQKETEGNCQKGLISKEEVEMSLTGQKKMFPNGIAKCGADALRFTLCEYDVTSKCINFDMTHCESNQRFCNKIWQALKFINLSLSKIPETMPSKIDDENLNIFDKWILSRLYTEVRSVENHLNSYRFNLAVRVIRSFLHDQYCSIYLESSKPILWGDSLPEIRTTSAVLFNCFETSLRLLSPFMPYLTEELYHALPVLEGFEPSESIMISDFPRAEDWEKYSNEEIQKPMDIILNLMKETRKIKDLNFLKKDVPVFVSCPDEFAQHFFGNSLPLIKKLTGKSEISRVEKGKNLENYIKADFEDDITVYVATEYDLDVLLKQLKPSEQRRDSLVKRIEKTKKKKFSSEQEREEKLKGLEEDLKKMEELIATINRYRNEK